MQFRIAEMFANGFYVASIVKFNVVLYRSKVLNRKVCLRRAKLHLIYVPILTLQILGNLRSLSHLRNLIDIKSIAIK